MPASSKGNTKKKEPLAQTMLNGIVNIIMAMSVLIFIIAIYTVYQYRDNPSEAFLLGYKPVYVMTGSMEPTMRTNGIAIIQKAEYQDIAIDDIILYEYDQKMITHRVVDISDEGIRTKGDNNNMQDAYLLNEDNVKGKVIAIWNWTADIVEKWNSPNGKIEIIAIAILIVLLIIFLTYVTHIAESRPPKRKPQPAVGGTQQEAETSPSLGNDKIYHACSVEETNNTDYIFALYNQKQTRRQE